MSTPSISDLETPALLVDVDVLKQNLTAMADLARDAGVDLRPHFKTHKCVALAKRQLALGAIGGTVAKPGEAEVFFGGGIDDLLIATPVVDPRKIDRVLASVGNGRLTVLVESEEGARFWGKGAARAARTLPVVLEVDVGMGRTGVAPGEDAVPLAKLVSESPNLEFRGVMTHAGHGYAASSSDELAAIGRAEGETLVATAHALEAAGIPCPVVSVGSTPTVAHSARVPGVTEIRPGNYLFHDGIQVALGVVTEERCALSVLATVVARPGHDRVVLDAGSKTLSSDQGVAGGAVEGFGFVQERSDHRIRRLSEEHGILVTEQAAEYRIGQKVRIVPNHACVTVNLHDEFVAVRGRAIETRWRIDARGRII